MNETQFNQIRLMLLINFIELQDIKRQLDIRTKPDVEVHSYKIFIGDFFYKNAGEEPCKTDKKQGPIF